MTDAFFAPLRSRGLIRLTGENVIDFLQGLVTNDVSALARGRAIYAALLTPQGKYLHDFHLLPWDDATFIECDAHRRDDLVRRLNRYRLRAPIEIEDTGDAYETFAAFGPGAMERLGLAAEEGTLATIAEGLAYVDPRNATLGARASFPAGRGEAALENAGLAAADRASYDALRMSLGIAEGDPEIEPEKSFPMDYGLDGLHGISFTKGCFVGQEVTARMKSRSLVRRRLVPVDIDGPAPVIGTPITAGSETAGELRAVSGAIGLALVKIDQLEKAIGENTGLACDGARLIPREND